MKYHSSKFILDLEIEFVNRNNLIDKFIYDCECEIKSKIFDEIDKAKIKKLVMSNIMIVFGIDLFNTFEKNYDFDIEWFE